MTFRLRTLCVALPYTLLLTSIGCGDDGSATASQTDATTVGPGTSETEAATETTTESTTEAPTTEAPTTEAPTTEAPTTDAPTESTTDPSTDTDPTTDSETDTETESSSDTESESESDTESDTDMELLEISGMYLDNFGTEHDISETEWVQTFDGSPMSFLVDSFDNGSGVLVAQNAETNDFNPGLWSKFEWTTTDDLLWYCQTAFDAATAEDALAAAPADRADPANSGCGGFSWTQLLPL